MTRLETMAAWFFTCLGTALLGVSILVVPPNLFADTGSECGSTCGGECGGDMNCYYSCVGACCAGACQGDSSCQQSCCEIACGGDQTCLDQCNAAQKQCWNANNRCDTGCFTQGTCSKTHTGCTAAKTGCKDCICRLIGGIECKCVYP